MEVYNMARNRKNQESYDYLVQRHKQLAKAADTRLRRLEALSGEKGFGSVLNWAYAKAKKLIRKWSGENAEYFDVKPPSKMQSLRAKIKDMERFMAMPSSSKRTLVKLYKQRAETLNKQYGTKFTWESMGSFFESREWEDMEKDYGSDTAIMVIGEFQKHEDDEKLLNAIEQSGKSNLKLENRKVSDAIDDMLNKYGLGVFDLYK